MYTTRGGNVVLLDGKKPHQEKASEPVEFSEDSTSQTMCIVRQGNAPHLSRALMDAAGKGSTI